MIELVQAKFFGNLKDGSAYTVNGLLEVIISDDMIMRDTKEGLEKVAKNRL